MENELLALPLKFDRNGFQFWQICRTHTAAIYEQRTADGRHIFYEVWRIRTKPPGVFKGKQLPLREVIPGNEVWGRDGWTYYDLNTARLRYDQINGRVKDPPAGSAAQRVTGTGI